MYGNSISGNSHIIKYWVNHMIKRLFRNKWYIIGILLLIIIEPSVTSWLYLWLEKMYNSVTIGSLRIEIIRLILIGVSMWMAKRLLMYTISVIKARFICNIKQDLKHDIFLNLFQLQTGSLADIAASGEYISVFANDIVIIEQRYFANIISLISQAISIVILGSTFFSMNSTLAGLMLIFNLIVLFVPLFFAKRLNAASARYSSNLSKFTQKLKEFISAYSTIKNYSTEATIVDRFEEDNRNTENSKFGYDCALSLADSIGSLLAWFSRIMIIGTGLVMVARGEILLGTVISAQAFSEELATPLQGFIENVNSIKSVKYIVKKVEKLMAREELTINALQKTSNKFDNDKVEIEFQNLTINANDNNIVKEFSFKFQHGRKYLIIGKNGAGKSSLFKMLKRHFREYEGSILINGIELKSIPNEELSCLVSYLTENVAMFSGTVEENILFGRKVSSQMYREALNSAHVELDSHRHISENGANVSSGEQRRIEIARSLISPATVIVFDEVVSTLDIETAYDIEEAALNFDDKTVVFISHNFSGKLIRRYDEILIMKEGNLVDHGNYDDLLERSEDFRRICNIKFGQEFLQA